MVLEILLALTQAVAPSPPTLDGCAGVTSRPDGSVVGDRAIMSTEGKRAVVQCGDGSVISWAGGLPTRIKGRPTLFEAARRERLVPDWARCPWPAILGPNYPGTPDCDVIDQATDGSAIVVRNREANANLLLVRGRSPKDFEPGQLPGDILGRPNADQLLIVDGRTVPERLEYWPLTGGKPRLSTTLARRDLLFEEGEGRATEPAYADAANLIVIAFGGSFRVAEEIAVARAYSRDGRERWSLRRPLPSRDQSLIVGDYPKLFIFRSGAFGALRRTSNRTGFDLLDLRTGRVIATMAGWPIAASRDGGLLMVRTGPERIELRTVDVQP